MKFLSKIVQAAYHSYGERLTGNKKKILNLVTNQQDFWPSQRIKHKYDVSIRVMKGFNYFVIKNKNSKNHRNVITYIHGGAYIMQISPFHWAHITNIIDNTNALVIVPIYPLTTDEYCNQLDTINFLLTLYEYFTNKCNNTTFSIMGDSAGGNFALILAQQIKIKKLKRPKNIILFSPLLSFYVGEEDSKKIKEDPVLPFHLLKEVNIMQLGKNNPKNPLFSPFFGDNKNIGNIYIYCGQNEVFASAIKDYCNKLDQDKVTYTLNIKKNMFHDYPIFVLTKEALETNKLIYKIFKK